MKTSLPMALALLAGIMIAFVRNACSEDLNLPSLPAKPKLDDARWWPLQGMPKGIVSAKNAGGAYDFIVQSVAGLAAKAAKEGRGDEMVWVETNNVDEKDWLERLRVREARLEMRGALSAWELVDRFVKRGVIKGYILYRSDRSKGGTNEHRPGMDCSVNVATSLAGILDGIIVEETLEAEAKAHGLKLLIDVREKTQAWCFENYRDRFNRRMACTQDPRKPHIRDLAIAQKAFTVYGYDDPTPAVMKWLDPLSPILGWNGGDEFQSTKMSTVQGHIQTATDWCMNLPVLMAGSEQANQAKVKDFDPRTIDWKDTRSGISFVSSDGDNVQFYEGSFFRNAGYWGNSERGKIPFGWSCCFGHLAQLCPQAVDYAAKTQSPNDSFIEWGGGYFYPDLFGSGRTDRWELLAQQSRRTWALMKKNNTRIIGFNVTKFDSADARKAYEVIASQADGVQGILVFQYDPYEGGAGKVFWAKDRNGVEIPVISARYSIWEHANNRERAGTPAKVAREIRQTVEKAGADGPRYDWAIVHLWSWFKKTPGDDENAENMPQRGAAATGGERGYGPATWCAEKLGANVRTLNSAEMIWRVRMMHNAKQTKKAIEEWQP
jgi:hypothetical protein